MKRYTVWVCPQHFEQVHEGSSGMCYPDDGPGHVVHKAIQVRVVPEAAFDELQSFIADDACHHAHLSAGRLRAYADPGMLPEGEPEELRSLAERLTDCCERAATLLERYRA